MRRNNLFRLAVCAGILFMLLSRPAAVSACSCVADVTLSESFTIYNAVFAGKVVRIADNYAPYFSTIDYILYKIGIRHSLFGYFFLNNERMYGFDVFFKVLKSWKGVEKTFVKVNTGRGGGDCGYSFEVGKEYLVYASYAYGVPGSYWVTGICSRNAELPKATEDLNYLRSLPELPLEFKVPIPWAETDSITFALAVLVVGVVIFARQWRQRKN